jgi:ubiquitin-conjugating enzyme E2 S
MEHEFLLSMWKKWGCFLLLCRLYTGIHAKPKPKFKSGAISESTTALNVDQTNTEQKSTAAGAALTLPSPLAPSTTSTRGNGQEQPVAVAPITDTGVSGSQKKEGGLAKVHADKKKIDARKKSLKRL